jgi:hypothetical protein
VPSSGNTGAAEAVDQTFLSTTQRYIDVNAEQLSAAVELL